jgi:RNA polymerase sigma-70 factor (ECF subfamily)
VSSEEDLIYYELLVLRCRRGDRDALEEMVRHWERRLLYYLRRLLGDEDDVWDVLQETWVTAFGGIKTLREPRTLPVWLYRIARNRAMTKLRGKYSDREFIQQEDSGLETIPEPSESLSFEDAEQIHYGLAKISPPHREVLTLHFLDDLSIDDIAEVLGAPGGTVKSRLHFAKKALRTVIEQEEAA